MNAKIAFLFALMVGLGASFAPASVGGANWEPIQPDELMLEASSIDTDADAEAIFWRVRVEDEWDGRSLSAVLDNYIRIKIFTAAGAERFAEVAIEFERKRGLGNVSVQRIEGRTIKPDGTILELRDDAKFQTTLVKSARGETRTRRFVLPGVEPGCLIEYRFREVHHGVSSHNLALYLQRDIPVQTIQYSIKPIERALAKMRHIASHATISPFERSIDGFYTTTVRQMRALVSEPHMPPESHVRAWLLVDYALDSYQDPDAGWLDIGKNSAKAFRRRVKPNGDIKKLATALTTGLVSSEEKLREIFDWCRSNVRNLTDDRMGDSLSVDHPKKILSARATLKYKTGWSSNINWLFASLAQAAGFEVRLARTMSRDQFVMIDRFASEFFLDASSIAVLVDGAWRFFDPGDSYLPFGSLRWQEEGVPAMICNDGPHEFVETPMSSPDDSQVIRTADLALSKDGAIEGDIQLTYTGHFSRSQRLEEAALSARQREERLSDRFRSLLGTAQVTDVRFENLPDLSKPFIVRGHVFAENYAPVIGDRIVLQPSLFEKGTSSRFPSQDRVHPVSFDFPWSERDTVRIDLPAGYAVEEASQPERIQAQGVGSYGAMLRLSRDARQLIYVRLLKFGKNGAVYFPASSYTAIKRFFDAVVERDEHALTLFDPKERQ